MCPRKLHFPAAVEPFAGLVAAVVGAGQRLLESSLLH